MYKKWLLAVGMLIVSASGHTGWRLLPGDALFHFVSIKSTHVAEVHRFKRVQGKISDQGKVDLRISLASVDTKIGIRDERMRDLLFETNIFPYASYSTQVDIKAFEMLSVGRSRKETVEGVLQMHGMSLVVKATVIGTRLAGNRIEVVTAEPIIINASRVGLTPGVEKLREIAGLDSISHAVPVTFRLIFSKR